MAYTTATSGTTAAVWYSWCDSDSTNSTTSASSGATWRQWVDSTDFSATASTYRVVRREYRYAPPPETEEQKQARLAREAEVARLAEERKRQEAEALQRAEDLLVMHLNAQQLKDWQREKFFDVFSQSGKRFRIRNFGSLNVEEYNEEGRLVMRHCIVPHRIRVPLPDQLLAQKFMLECHETDFMQIANHRIN